MYCHTNDSDKFQLENEKARANEEIKEIYTVLDSWLLYASGNYRPEYEYA